MKNLDPNLYETCQKMDEPTFDAFLESNLSNLKRRYEQKHVVKNEITYDLLATLNILLSTPIIFPPN